MGPLGLYSPPYPLDFLCEFFSLCFSFSIRSISLQGIWLIIFNQPLLIPSQMTYIFKVVIAELFNIVLVYATTHRTCERLQPQVRL